MKTKLSRAFVMCLGVILAIGCSEKKSIESLELNKDSLELIRGTSEQLFVTVTSEDPVYWVSSDNEVATVDGTGLVKAVSIGEAVISAVSMDRRADCSVKVIGVPVSAVILDKTSCDIIIGNTVVLNASVTPENADYEAVEWISSDPEIATVDENGCVTAVSAGTVNVSAVAGGVEGVCEVNVLPSAKIGDYFYSDGSYSSDLDASKDVVGIVFWVGDPTQNDAALKKDFPNCTHGLVVSLDEKMTMWQKNAQSVNDWIQMYATEYEPIIAGDNADARNRIIGYNNTKAIEAFNDDKYNVDNIVDAVKAVTEYNASCPVSSTSGWFLPSAKELSLLCSGEYDGDIWNIYYNQEELVENRDFINGRLSALDNAVQLSEIGVYWTSFEYSQSESYYVFFQKGFVRMDYKDSNRYFVRYVLAF